MFNRMIFIPRAWAGMVCLALLMAWLAPAAGQTPPATAPANTLEGLPIRRVDVVGNTRTRAQLILDQVRAQQGQPYSRALIDLDVKSISALERFITVRADVEGVGGPGGRVTGVDVTFVVEERSLITAVEITGNRQFKDTEIRAQLTSRPGTAIFEFSINADRTRILEMYHEKGYYQASVDVDQNLLNTQGILRFQIIEGPVTRITKVEIDGNVALSDSYIKWRLQTKTYIWIFRKGTLDQQKLDADVGSIRDMYQKKGYLDVRASYTLDFSEDKGKVVVHFVVLEGMRYRVGKLNITGNAVFSKEELLSGKHIEPGDYAESDKVQALKRTMDDKYDHEGYIEHQIDVLPEFTETPGVVDLNINITEGKPYTVGEIVIRGNANMQDKVVRRQIRIYPDQTFDMVQVRKSIERLKATRLFKDVRITPYASPNDPADVRTAQVEVVEDQTGRFSLGAGISTNSGLTGQFSMEQSNFDITNPPRSIDEYLKGQSFKGAGQYFRILLEPGTEFQRYRLTFQEPYLFDSPYSFSNDLYYFTRSRESWDERRIGDTVTFGRRFGDIWSLAVALRAEEVTLSHAQDYFNDRITQSRFPIIGPNGSIRRVNDTAQEILNELGDHFLTSIKPSVGYDSTDSQIFPTTGMRASLAVEQYGALGGEIDITKLTLGFDWYKTLYTDLFDRKTVLVLHNDIGVIPFGNSPTYERFYLGGIGDLRAFRFRGVSPRSGPLNDPIGGDFSWNTTAEVNFPIYEEVVRGVVFVDVGTVERHITLGTVRSDIGAGVRIKVPFLGNVPVAIDFGYPVTKAPEDRTQFISVSLGLPF